MTAYNLILDTDSYKHSHFLQYPPSTSMVNSYVESRGGAYEQVLFFGLQAWLKKALSKPITTADIDEADTICAAHGVPFNRAGWNYIANKHGGYLPLEIEALPEGTVVATRNALVQVRNTDPACFWLTSFMETAMLRAIWYPTTVATISYHLRQVISQYLQDTSDAVISDILPFMLHDFGSRGVSSEESAGLGGLAHLISFQGSDTMAALLTGQRYYGIDMAGFSVPAAEHSTITSWGRAGEQAAYDNMITRFGPLGGIVSVVADSYDIFTACRDMFGDRLKDKVDHMASTYGSRLVVRPDSGNPVDMVEKVVSLLMEQFGHSTNSKGYRLLPDHVRVLQGDGIDAHMLQAILTNLKTKGISAENMVFGMGGGLLQKCDRDTLKFAMKASAITVGDETRDVFKDPITDSGKTSKKGILSVADGQTIRRKELSGRTDMLRTVWRNGQLLVDDEFATIRDRSAG